jgi:type I restriction enzyme R subunit
MADKNSLTERDICTKFITPALVAAGWNLRDQIREEVSFTKGRIIVQGELHTRGVRKRADYILYYRSNIPLAVVEAKDGDKSIGWGIQQALDYAETLGVPFAFSSNGTGFLLHDRTGASPNIEQVLTLDEFPSPDQLWQRYCQWKGLDTPQERRPVETPYYDEGSRRVPRYYQLQAINEAVEAVAKKQNRILLVMATGTGKTYTAFQIIWRLWKSGVKKRVLFLADRNILVDQTKNNDFKPFGAAMTKIGRRHIDKSYEIYLSLYQAITGPEEKDKIYRNFTPDFFDLIVIDECHRGSASEDSVWREILDYFSSATHVGLTATPKETKDISSSSYFGEPIYSYSLKQGIDDGFLAPFKVIRIDIDKDIQGWRPTKGQTDNTGQLVEDRIYNQMDMDRTLILEKRTELVAKKITEYLSATDPYSKTIVFCEDINHAERMRQALVNLNPKKIAENRKYVMRITGDDNLGKAELENFINPEERYPVIATTSKLMATGVDAQTCKLIVLDQNLKSMIEFKQIIGRGTRVNEDYGKFWFTIMDFKKTTELFADPAFDGEPIVVFETKWSEPLVASENLDSDENKKIANSVAAISNHQYSGTALAINSLENNDILTGRVKYVIGDVSVYVIAERVQYYGPEGKLITESLKDYTRKIVLQRFKDFSEFNQSWKNSQQKSIFLSELKESGIFIEPLAIEFGMEFDVFDLIAYSVFDVVPTSRRKRAESVTSGNSLLKFNTKARKVMLELIEKYVETGIENIEDIKILTLDSFQKIGTASELILSFGGKKPYLLAIQELAKNLYI